MTSDRRVTMHKGAAALLAITLLAAGAGVTFVWMRHDAGAGGHTAALPSPEGALPSPGAAVASHNSPLPTTRPGLPRRPKSRPLAQGTSVRGRP